MVCFGMASARPIAIQRSARISQPDYGDKTMSKLIISDLPKNEELDLAAIAAIFGGRRYSSGFGFIAPYTKATPLSAGAAVPVNIFNTSVFNTNVYNVSNTYIDFDSTVIQQNPTIFNVHNGAGSSGINNSFNVLSLTAASPAVSG